jgi:hypothetical protein
MTTTSDVRVRINLPKNYLSGPNSIATDSWTEPGNNMTLHIPVKRDPEHRRRGLKVHSTPEELEDSEGNVHTVITVNIEEREPVIDITTESDEEKGSGSIQMSLEVNDNGRTYSYNSTEPSFSDSPPPLEAMVQHIG